MKKILVFVLLCLGIFGGIYAFGSTQTSKPKTYVLLAHKTFFVDLAETKTVQQKGLSGRVSLPTDEGMLFLFEKPGDYGFWMEDMLFPLDIIWISPDWHVTHIEHSIATSTYPTVFYAHIPSQYVLEISAGEASKLDVHVGDTVQYLEK